MTPSRSEDVALFLLHEKVEVLSSPRILTISGQAALMEVSSLVEGQSTGFRLSANPYLIADTFVIRLSHSVTIGELAKESPGAVHESLVGSGQTLVLLIEQAGTNEATPDRYVVLLTPEHLTEEEADRKQPNEESLRK
jgi:hypothetical protein